MEEKIRQEIKEIVDDITDMVNSYSTKNAEIFIEEMERQHRTLQQSFTRLCLKWIEYCADPSYRTDGRNQMSHDVCYEILEMWKKEHGRGGFDPSQMLPLI